MDNGHFISRDKKALRYYEDNCRPQNRSSNRFSGEADKDIFGEHLKREIGQERFDKLEIIKNYYFEETEANFRMIAATYRLKVNELVKELGIVNPFK